MQPEFWALRLFERSELKKAKYREICRFLPETTGLRCLDVGGDNGVISLLLRRRRGEWHSADLDEASVEAIRRLVGDRVHRFDEWRTGLPDASFDLVVIVDYLEHIHQDAEFIGDLARIVKPGGTLIINVPHTKPRSVLNRLRHAIGLTDELHGHVRPGYSLPELGRLLRPGFQIDASRTYSKAPMETLDLLLNFGYERLKRRRRTDPESRSRKGTLVTINDWQAHQKEFRILAMMRPVFRLASWMDRLWVFQSGYRLLVRATRRESPPG